MGIAAAKPRIDFGNVIFAVDPEDIHVNGTCQRKRGNRLFDQLKQRRIFDRNRFFGFARPHPHFFLRKYSYRFFGNQIDVNIRTEFLTVRILLDQQRLFAITAQHTKKLAVVHPADADASAAPNRLYKYRERNLSFRVIRVKLFQRCARIQHRQSVFLQQGEKAVLIPADCNAFCVRYNRCDPFFLKLLPVLRQQIQLILKQWKQGIDLFPHADFQNPVFVSGILHRRYQIKCVRLVQRRCPRAAVRHDHPSATRQTMKGFFKKTYQLIARSAAQNQDRRHFCSSPYNMLFCIYSFGVQRFLIL